MLVTQMPSIDTASLSKIGNPSSIEDIYASYILNTSDPLEEAYGVYLWETKFKGLSPVLDVGCGRCWFGHYRPNDTIGIDPNRQIVEHYRGLGLRVEVGDACNIPFPDDTFEGILANYILEHLNEPERAMVEFRRVLKPGGYLYIAVPHPRTICTTFFDDFTHVKPYNLRGLEMLAQFTGFSRYRAIFDLYRGPLNVKLKVAEHILKRFGPMGYSRYLMFWDRFGRRFFLVNRNMCVLETWK